MLNKIVFGESIHHFEKERETKRAEKLVNREFTFVSGKINVLVGENGSGKSSLISTLAKKLLAYNYGHTRLDDRLLRFADEFWQKEDKDRWYSDEVFMSDVKIESDGALYATYVSADWTPCDSESWAHALCYGLGNEATDHFKRTHDFSSGQGMGNVIAHTLEFLKKPSPELFFDKTIDYHLKETEHETHISKRAKILHKILPPIGSNIVALFDEPERTLDLGSQFAFWKMMTEIAKRPHVQIVIASHSCIPLMNPELFNFVEMDAGYTDKLLTLAKDLK